jgi:hypothetical protein
MKRQICVTKSFAAWALVMAVGTSALLAQNEHSWLSQGSGPATESRNGDSSSGSRIERQRNGAVQRKPVAGF